MAVATILLALRPHWSQRAAWLVVAANAVVVVFTFIAKEAGENLEAQLTKAEGPSQLIDNHAKWGDAMPVIALVVLLVSLLITLTRTRTKLRPVLVAVSVVAAGVAIFWTIKTGHTGAQSVWSGG